MNLSEAYQILDRHNRWRRSEEGLDMENTTELGIAIDVILKFVRPQLPEDYWDSLDGITAYFVGE